MHKSKLASKSKHLHHRPYGNCTKALRVSICTIDLMAIAPSHLLLSTVAMVAEGAGPRDDDGVRMLAERTATGVGLLRATLGRGVPVLDTERKLTGVGLLRPDLLALVAELCTMSGTASSSASSSSWESFSKSESSSSLPLVLIADGGADAAASAFVTLT